MCTRRKMKSGAVYRLIQWINLCLTQHLLIVVALVGRRYRAARGCAKAGIIQCSVQSHNFLDEKTSVDLTNQLEYLGMSTEVESVRIECSIYGTGIE